MAILATQRVLTLDYWKFASDIVEGDILFDRDGKPVKVKLVQQYRAEECYKVYFNDGLSVAGDVHLRLPTENEKYRNRTHDYRGKFKFKRPLKPLSVTQLLETPLKGRQDRLELSVPTAKPLELPTQTLPVPPFVFGFWFFNHRADQTMQPPPGTTEFVHRKFKDSGYLITKTYKARRAEERFLTRPSVRSHLIPDVPIKIPNNYLLASAAQRLELLRGIIHSNSRLYDKQTDKFRFSHTRKDIVLQVQYLAESLGCRTKAIHAPKRGHYTVFIKTKLRLMEEQFSPRTKVHQQRRYINEIIQVPPQLCIHIETENPDTGFLVGEGFIATC